MKSWSIRLRYLGLIAAGSTLSLFNGCGLSDRQLTSIWESVLTTSLSTLFTSALTTATEAAA